MFRVRDKRLQLNTDCESKEIVEQIWTASLVATGQQLGYIYKVFRSYCRSGGCLKNRMRLLAGAYRDFIPTVRDRG